MLIPRADPSNGDIRVGDTDNIVIDKEDKGNIIGTPRFMAPEIVREEAKPNTLTDLFSLSVLLFYILFLNHPLEGKKESTIKAFDLHAQRKLYGTEPIFIFDAINKSNAPDPVVHKNAQAFWDVYPQFLRDLFVKGFTRGLNDPHSRVRESEWKASLIRLRDLICYCNECEKQNFYDISNSVLSTQDPTCWKCQEKIGRKHWIRIIDKNGVEKFNVVLNHDTRIYPHHIYPERADDFENAIAEVNRHPTDPKRWGLKNLTTETWTATTKDNKNYTIEPGKTIIGAIGTKINFGKRDGKICYSKSLKAMSYGRSGLTLKPSKG